ncbi:family 14 glycosylhydrolase [Limibacter armeniacum]|uniref:family 14 glycosylhydrolase n=1 Tax=Limibacter armeniacum TaxID=466084 RepID=UPI002FE66821
MLTGLKTSNRLVEVTAPLSVNLSNLQERSEQEWKQFEQWVKEMKQLGVQDVVVPIFWGRVNEEDRRDFDWSYCLRVKRILESHRMGFVPELCFHFIYASQLNQVQTLPEWLWGELLITQSKVEKISDLKYVSETGEKSSEYVSLWSDEYVVPLYQEFIHEFLKLFQYNKEDLRKIIISMGPSGELRYPSFDLHDWGGYPNRGTLQCYSRLAKKSFVQYVMDKYGAIEAVNEAWDRIMNNFGQVELPDRNYDIFKDKAYINTQYGRDVVNWYHSCLVEHGNRMLTASFKELDNLFFNHAKVGFRIAGVHWKISDPVEPRVAEITSGIIDTHEKLSYYDQGEYVTALEKIVPEEYRDRTVLHFTCVEKENKDHKGYSRGGDLSGWIADAANKLGIGLVAENGVSDALYHNRSWDQMEKMLFREVPFHGVNLKSIQTLMEENPIGRQRLTRMVEGLKNDLSTVPKRKRVFRVMGPLHVKATSHRKLLEDEQWFEFDRQLKLIKETGVTAVSIDVWWGLVQANGENSYDWRYYDTIVRKIRSNGLNWVPILSFHQAGGNVNDDFLQLIPLWVWGKLMEYPEIKCISDLQYVSETGDASIEYVSLWADRFVMPYYRKFMEAFRDHYSEFADMTEEVNVSLGPAGELRYPSYNAHDWGDYPNRGTLQCYSRLAKESFRKWVVDYYQDIESVNKAWGTHIKDEEEIHLPADVDAFFTSKDYIHTVYGRNVIEWYNRSLVKHGRRVLQQALDVFGTSEYRETPIGFKIPGIHWNISDPEMPRSSEITAGLIASHENLSAKNHGEYKEFLGKIVTPDIKDRLELHFTCLEKYNMDYKGYSRAEDLVIWMAEAAYVLGVEVMGENATPHELLIKEGWEQVERALTREKSYKGLTVLRMQDLMSAPEYGLASFKELIQKLSY